MDEDTDRTPATKTVEHLEEGISGRWRVFTQRATHEFDLDRMTYTRQPGSDSQSFERDGIEGRISRVVDWPTVGQRFFVFFDDPENPLMEQWRISSTVRRIESVDPDARVDEDNGVAGADREGGATGDEEMDGQQ